MLWACMLISSVGFHDGCWGHLDQQTLFRFENLNSMQKKTMKSPSYSGKMFILLFTFWLFFFFLFFHLIHTECDY